MPDEPRKRPSRVPLLERTDLRPDERRRIGRVVATLLGWGLVASAALGLLALWHLIRRGRLLREGLAPPRIADLPEAEDFPPP